MEHEHDCGLVQRLSIHCKLRAGHVVSRSNDERQLRRESGGGGQRSQGWYGGDLSDRSGEGKVQHASGWRIRRGAERLYGARILPDGFRVAQVISDKGESEGGAARG